MTTPRLSLHPHRRHRLHRRQRPVQLLRLAPSWEKQETVFISTLPAVQRQLGAMGRTYIVGDCNRQHPLRTLAVMWRTFYAILRERPDVVISTGAAPVPMASM